MYCLDTLGKLIHDDVIKWKQFSRYWSIVRGLRRSLVKSPLKGHWRGALMFPLICAWTNGWVNNQDAGDLRRHRTQHGITVMELRYAVIGCDPYWSVLQLYPSRNISNQTVKVLNHAYHNRLCCNNPILRFGQYNTMGHLSGLDCGSSCRHHMRTHLGKGDHGMVRPYPPMQYIFSHLTQSPWIPDRSPQFWSVCNPSLSTTSNEYVSLFIFLMRQHWFYFLLLVSDRVVWSVNIVFSFLTKRDI